MIIGKKFRTVLVAAGFGDFIGRLEEIKFEDSKIDVVDISHDNISQVSFITREKAQKFIQDMINNGHKHYEGMLAEELFAKWGDDSLEEAFRSTEKRNRYGTRTKLGRFMRKFFTEEEFPTSSIEKLTAVAVQNTYTLKVVTGDDISFFYHESRYAEDSGSLGGSCMRYDDCEDYFKVYEDNAKMLILTSKLDQNVIFGRAILWDNVIIESKGISIKVMDRIYTTSTEQESLFKMWANENGYYYKDKQNFSCVEVCYRNENLKIDNDSIIRIGRKYESYPYMDTFSGLKSNGDLVCVTYGDKELRDMRISQLRDTNGNYLSTCSHCAYEAPRDDIYYMSRNSYDINDMHNVDDEFFEKEYCYHCWNELFIYIEDVKYVFKDRYIGKYDKCAITGEIHLIENMYDYKRLNTETREVENKKICKDALPYVIYNASNDTYEDRLLSKCSICGKDHTSVNMREVYYVNKEKAISEKSVEISTKVICEDCFGDGVKNNNYKQLKRYMKLVDSYSLSKDPYYDVQSALFKCHSCNTIHNVLEENNDKKYSWVMKRTDLHCVDCTNKAIDFLDSLNDKYRKRVSEIEFAMSDPFFKYENGYVVSNMYQSRMAKISMMFNLSLDELFLLSEEEATEKDIEVYSARERILNELDPSTVYELADSIFVIF